ncbi:MAG TPA: hypothetical protein VG602_09760 [Actinomycetota bacterium]|nr:hypothetical protein [Actinomycetota bacterium]
MTKRRAEANDVRSWDRGVAEANQLGEVRGWVVWGLGPPPERAAEAEAAEERPGNPGGDIARQVAETTDPEWAGQDDGWVTVVHADEDDVDAWVADEPAARGYAPYLVAAENAAAAPKIQRGILRGDVVRRRKEKGFDAGRPD